MTEGKTDDIVQIGIITGERIRDKIVAPKKKGMWMGGRRPGPAPLQYPSQLYLDEIAGAVGPARTRWSCSTGPAGT